MKGLGSKQDDEEPQPQRKKMLLSSRANPPRPLNLNLNLNLNPRLDSDKPERDRERERYLSIKSLLPSTPIPSPSLPSILPRHGKKPPKLNSRRIVRSLLWLSLFIGVYYLFTFSKLETAPRLAADIPSFSPSLHGKVSEVSDDQIPTVITLTDTKGKQRWTVSIPARRHFPLDSAEYVHICSQAEQVSRQVSSTRTKQSDYASMQYDANFIDVDDAQQLRGSIQPHSNSNSNSIDLDLSDTEDEDHPLPLCNTTLTYILDATDAGLGSALLGIWLSYSVAQRENRTFFIDDTHFPYGNYSTFFIPPAPAECRPPAPSQRIPCPRQAKHVVVSAATTRWMFGEFFHRQHTTREMFEMARTGYDALFHSRLEDAEYVLARTAKLRAVEGHQRGPGGGEGQGHGYGQGGGDSQGHGQGDGDGGQGQGHAEGNAEGNVASHGHDHDHDHSLGLGLVGIHIRRGDRHPFEPAHQLGYIPPERYLSVARQLVGQSERWRFILASDDAEMYDSDSVDLPGTVRAQQRISLASKKNLGSGLGWEGGFFKDVFWGLGVPVGAEWESRRAGSPAPTKAKEKAEEKEKEKVRAEKLSTGQGGSLGQSHGQGQGQSQNQGEDQSQVDNSVSTKQDNMLRNYKTNPTKSALQLRELLGRAYLLDLAVLAQTDKVVCGVSSHACRILAVMLGWERAFENHDWTNVDGGYGWRALDF